MMKYLVGFLSAIIAWGVIWMYEQYHHTHVSFEVMRGYFIGYLIGIIFFLLFWQWTEKNYREWLPFGVDK